jgi:5-formyltetrahydrofolate cyclo-ligase
MSQGDLLLFEKAGLRRRQIQLREDLDPGQAKDWSQQMVGHLLRSPQLSLIIGSAANRTGEASSEPLAIGLYVAMRQEADFEAAWPILEQARLAIALPRMIRQDGLATLEFRAAPAGSELRHHLKPAGLGVLELDDESMVVEPALIILPGLAFDQSGNRLGWGKGYYDHYLARRLADLSTKRPLLIGAAYPNQILPAVPAGPADIPVDFLLTPSGIMETSTNR